MAVVGGLVLSVLVLIKWGLPRLLPKLLTVPFKAKGAVLRGATALLHSVERAQAPAEGTAREDEGAATAPLEYYDVELTITPAPATRTFALWEPDELRLARPNEKPEEPERDEVTGSICAIEVQQDGRFEPTSGMKYEGPQRLRMLVSTPRGCRRIRLRYYFELFGDIALPVPPRPAAVANGPLSAGRSPFARAR
jgi:hypothetical protein